MGLSVSHLKVASFLLVFGSIPSARAEVTNCKEIAALPAIINTSGIWCLKKNLVSAATTGNAIDVQVGAVTIDLNGWTLTGSVAATTQAVGIHSLNRTNVTIRNGTIRGFLAGVFLEGPGSINDVIEDMHLDQARRSGIRIKQTVRAIVRNNQITATGGISDSFGIEIDTAKKTTISNNNINGVAATFSAVGIGVTNADMTEIRDNSILDLMRIDTGGGGGVGGGFHGVGSFTSTNTMIQSNRILNGAVQANDGIHGEGGSGVNCVNNVIQRYFAPLAGCTLDSGNVTAP